MTLETWQEIHQRETVEGGAHLHRPGRERARCGPFLSLLQLPVFLLSTTPNHDLSRAMVISRRRRSQANLRLGQTPETLLKLSQFLFIGCWRNSQERLYNASSSPHTTITAYSPPLPSTATTSDRCAADVFRTRSSSAPHDRHDFNAPTIPSQQQQRQQSKVSGSLPNKTPDPIERLSTPSSLPRSIRRTPKFEAPPSPAPEPRQVHIAAASLGFAPKATLAAVDDLPENHPTVLGLIPLRSAPHQAPRRRRRLSQDLTEDPDEVSSERPQSPPRQTPSSVPADRLEPHPVVRISNHTHSAILFALEEALRNPNPFTPDLEEESASMADLMASGGVPPVSNGKPASTFRPAAAPGQTSSPSGIRGPRMIMQERAAREARQRAEAEQQQRERTEQEARILEQARRAEEQRRNAGVAAGQGTSAEVREPTNPQRQAQATPDINTARPRASTTSQPPPTRPGRSGTTNQPPPQTFTAPVPATQPNFGGAQNTGNGAQGGAAGGSKPRNSFPHAFERWETLSAHWEGLTSYWIRKLEQNKDELNRDPLNQQLARQVTDLSAAGANLFHAVVELQRLRASSERKFQRWFFETRAELERAQEVNAMLEGALEQERRGREDAIREAVENERGTSQAQRQLAEMRKELSISKEEARRAWEELGRREQEERDRTLSLQSGQPTIVGGVQVVPMTQGGPGRNASNRAQDDYQPEYGQGYPPESTTSQSQPPATAGGDGYLQPPGQHGSGGYHAPGSEGGYSEGEYVIDANGNFILDPQGNRIPFAAPPSTYSGSDTEAEEYETPATTNPPSGKQDSPSTSAGGGQWTGTYSDPQDYSGQGYGTPGWDTVPRHHHPTRLSDVMEEEDERSRASTSRV
ncbi:hypothetical protein FZEAL_5061 [Fusarium zealandicum]|uniref:Uncharacterized protein n=1 Tax=Fusarium zealandicum TaxID=1053134 RepID=A0A8H4ULI8_9HYPO|nr:hypothetical protein FZEAL_5061 [Fusarium zealandicum]